MLHVTNGDSAGGTLRLTGLGGDVLPWRDALCEGPIPALPPERLRELRARFLAECGWGHEGEILQGFEQRDRMLERSLRDRRPVVLWFEHDLYDQLQLFQILAQVAAVGHDSAKLELINVGVFAGRPDFHGLGELTADELESLWPARRPVTSELVELGRAAWEAVSAPEPMAIERFLEADSTELPFGAAALRRLVEELPAVDTGLARSERQLLESLTDGPRRPFEIFRASQEREEAPFDGDAWVWRRLASLGEGERPLISLAGGGVPPTPPPLGDARLYEEALIAVTEAGFDVLGGRADRVDLLGIDRWIGGTHLRPDRLWRWDGHSVIG